MLRRLLLTAALSACTATAGTPIDAPAPDAYWIPDARVPDARPVDARVPDAVVIPDASPPDARPGAYLDRCSSPAGCASGLCLEDVGGSSFCSRTCTSSASCASEHVCDIAGRCVPDDTGRPCLVATPETCARGLCIAGGPAPAPAVCTHTCTIAAECPAGYGCMDFGGTKVCVDIEKPCSGATDCASGLCLAGYGCTSTCTTVADCPARFDETSFTLTPYTCEAAVGTPPGPICTPPIGTEVFGDLAAGTACATDASGNVLCRSSACDDAAPLGPICSQTCNTAGDCGPGLGCAPIDDGMGGILFACELAGGKDLGEVCAHGYECESALCIGTTGAVCTRLCTDGLCPSGWSCNNLAGVWICQP